MTPSGPISLETAFEVLTGGLHQPDQFLTPLRIPIGALLALRTEAFAQDQKLLSYIFLEPVRLLHLHALRSLG